MKNVWIRRLMAVSMATALMMTGTAWADTGSADVTIISQGSSAADSSQDSTANAQETADAAASSDAQTQASQTQEISTNTEDKASDKSKESTEKTEEVKNTTAEWKESDGRMYCYGANGKPYKGLTNIKGKKYFFTKNGVQRTGWVKIKGASYYFCQKSGPGGFMAKKKTINHIRLGKNGKALSGGKRLKVLLKASNIVWKNTRPAWPKEQKLKKIWRYFLDNYQYLGSLNFEGGKNWEVRYADRVFTTKKGNCFAQGAAFAFLARACGYKAAAVSSGGHGWARVGGKVCDPTWEKVDRAHSYFMLDMSLSGVDGRPRYRGSEAYVKNI